MSHLTTIESEITNLVHLKQALDNLKLKYVEGTEENPLRIKGWNNETFEALLEIKTGGPYGIGVLRNRETGRYEFTADWWGVETYIEETQETFLKKISQQYSYCSVIEKVREQGYTLVKETVDDDKNIRLVLRKWD